MYTSWKALSNDELIRKCQAGERAALEELLRRYRHSIFKQAYRLTNRRDAADDVVAETYLRICRGIGTFKDAMSLPAWINRIVRNIWLDMLRRTQRRSEASLDVLEEMSVERCLYPFEVHGGIALQKRVEENERRSILDQAIAALPDYQRIMVALFYGEERTYEEISEMMGIPIGTVKSRLNRARYVLRERLTPQRTAWMD